MIGGSFQGPNPFAKLNMPFQQTTGTQEKTDANRENGNIGRMENMRNESKVVQEVGQEQTDRNKQVLDLLDVSFKNMPGPYDQEVGEIKFNPLPLGALDNLLFPSVSMFKGRQNYSKFDLMTLFYSFYYLAGTYQQYLAAAELKRRDWRFHKKYKTWFRQIDSQDSNVTITHV